MRSWRKLQSHDSSPLYYVDSNVFFYAKINDSKYGEASARILDLVGSERLTAAASSLVLLEVANAMTKYGLSGEVKSEVNAMLSLPMSMEILDSRDAKRGSEFFATYQISPYDCAHVAIMERIGSKLIISADRDFDKIREVTRVDPLKPTFPGNIE